MAFAKNAFINCPFDSDYHPLLKPLLFVVKKVGLRPRLALERFDSGEVRLVKIQELIEASKFGIHDLSRARAKDVGEYFRQNMPFELGLDYSCRVYQSRPLFRRKKILILEEEKYSTQKALSDLSFADCKCHNGNAEDLVYEVRNWFSENGLPSVSSASSLWDDYNIFIANLFDEKRKQGFTLKDMDRLPISEYLAHI